MNFNDFITLRINKYIKLRSFCDGLSLLKCRGLGGVPLLPISFSKALNERLNGYATHPTLLIWPRSYLKLPITLLALYPPTVHRSSLFHFIKLPLLPYLI